MHLNKQLSLYINVNIKLKIKNSNGQLRFIFHLYDLI